MNTATTTSTVTVNAAFLQEIKEVNQELWDLLARCRAFEAHASDGWRPWFQQINLLRELRDKLALHFALEEAYGYFEDPAFASPQVTQRAANLRSEHTALYVEISALVDMADELLHDRKLEHLTQSIPCGFDHFCFRLEQHEDSERELIQDAFIDELGEGD